MSCNALILGYALLHRGACPDIIKAETKMPDRAISGLFRENGIQIKPGRKLRKLASIVRTKQVARDLSFFVSSYLFALRHHNYIHPTILLIATYDRYNMHQLLLDTAIDFTFNDLWSTIGLVKSETIQFQLCPMCNHKYLYSSDAIALRSCPFCPGINKKLKKSLNP